MSTPKVPDAEVLPDPNGDVQLGEQVAARTRGTAGAVIAVRVSRDLLARISDYAAMRGMSVTEDFLEGAERLVAPEISASESPMRYRERLSRKASRSSQWHSIGLSILRWYWRLASDLVRQARLRRRWPRPEHFARMTPEQFESYIRSIGFDVEAREAQAEYEALRR